jgi:hypothetical protein
VKGGAAYARNAELDRDVGKTWRQLYGMYLDGKLDQAYANELQTEAQIAQGLATGALVRDDRLIEALEYGIRRPDRRSADEG